MRWRSCSGSSSLALQVHSHVDLRIGADQRPSVVDRRHGARCRAFTFFLYAFYQREKIYDIFETLCGARFTNSYNPRRRRDARHHSAGDREDAAFVKDFPKTIDEMEKLVNRNRIFVDR